MWVFRLAMWGRGVTGEQVEHEQREEARLLRRGVELLRAALAGRAGGELA